MAAAEWVEDDNLADIKHRLDKVRVDQARHKPEDASKKGKDTLKYFQTKFGSMVYDPTDPMQSAYDRKCARTGRRKSIEFEDLYLTKGSGQLFHPSSQNSSTNKTANARPAQASGRQRKISDPSSYYRRQEHGNGSTKHHGLSDFRNHKDPEGHRSQLGQPRKGILHPMTEEDKKLVDQRLSGIGGGGGERIGSAHSPPQQRRRKISSHSKTGSKH